jgi:4'-phosphopantetheinyl transferase
LLAGPRHDSRNGDPTIGPLALRDGEVHVWQANLDSQETESPIRLAPEECERAAQRPSGRLRGRFLRSRALLRAVLASYLGLAPEALVFDTGVRGKPHLRSFSRDRGRWRLAFNLSHARSCWVLAVSPQSPLGIDVEDTSRRVDVDGVGRRIFSPRELQTLRRLPAAVKKEAFFRCWTAREAIAKARGEGVFTRGAQFDVVADPALPPGVHERESSGTSGAGWVLTPIPVPAGFTCLLATAGTPVAFRSFRASP